MSITFKVWVLTITIDVLDLDTSDKDIKLGIKVSWG